MHLVISCAACGGNRLTLGQLSATDDDSAVSCEDCGHEVGTLGELKQNVIDQIARRPPPAGRTGSAARGEIARRLSSGPVAEDWPERPS